MTATDTGAAFEDITNPLTDSEAAELFLKRYQPDQSDADKPSDEDNEDTQRDETPSDDDPSDKPADDDEQPSEEEGEGKEKDDKVEDEQEPKYADPDVYVKIKIGDEEHAVPVKELQRLYGQEASLTKKSMEVADRRKAVDDEFAKATMATSSLLERAKARWEPFSKIDFLMASQQLEPEQYVQLRDAAMAAHQDVEYLERHLNGMMGHIKQREQADRSKAAAESIKVLSGPAEQGGIPNWNEKLYDEIRASAIGQYGAPKDVVDQVVEPWAIRIMHDAMLYRRGQSKVITKKVNKTPKKVIKTTRTPNSSKGLASDKVSQAQKRLAKSGSDEDAANLFMARWAAAAEDNE